MPGSPGHGGTVTGTQLHTDTRLSPDTLNPAPALGPGLTLAPLTTTLHHPSFQAPCLCAHLSASRPPGWQLTLALTIPVPQPMSRCARCPSAMHHPHPTPPAQTIRPPAGLEARPTCLTAGALLDAAAPAPALAHRTAALLPRHIARQDVVTGIRSRRVKVALPAPAARRALPGRAGPAGWGRQTWAGRCLGL